MRKLVACGLVLFVVAACTDEGPIGPVEQAPDTHVPSFSMGNGQGAVVHSNCFAPKGATILGIVPVSDSDWYLAMVKMVSSTCHAEPSGKQTESFNMRILPDIPVPLPDRAVTASLTDENGNPRLFDLHFPGGIVFPGPTVLEDIPIGFVFDAPPNDAAENCEFTTTPSGMHSGKCTLDGS